MRAPRAPRVLICGSRAWKSPTSELAYDLVHQIVAELPSRTVIIEGEATGIDRWARRAAVVRGLWVMEVPVRQSHWQYSRRAALERDDVMLDQLQSGADDRVVAIQNIQSQTGGTQYVIDGAHARGISVEVHQL